ncbi:hypothetical protein H0H93_011072, partial [Arthromyces matolae]
MSVFPDAYTLLEAFLDGIPESMRHKLIEQDKLSPEINTVEEFMAHAVAHEQSKKTADHFDRRSTRRHTSKPSKVTPSTPSPKLVGTFLARRSEMAQNKDPRVVIRSNPTNHKGNSYQRNRTPFRAGRNNGQSSQPRASGAQPAGPSKPDDPRVAYEPKHDHKHDPNACFKCGKTGHFAKDCRSGNNGPRAFVRAAHTAVASDHESPEEEAEDEHSDHAQEDQGSNTDNDGYDHSDENGEEYVTVDVYDNAYYSRDDESEYMMAMTDYTPQEEDQHAGQQNICMKQVKLRKASNQLSRPKYSRQEKECLVTYVE